MKVEWTKRGELRLRQCRDYVAQLTQDLATAWKFEDGLVDVSLQLTDFPLSGHEVREIKRKDIRELGFKEYRLIYKYTISIADILPNFTVSHQGSPVRPSGRISQ